QWIVGLARLLRITLHHLVHIALASLLGDDAGPMHQGLLGLDKVAAIEAPDPRMHTSVHSDGVTRTGFHAKTAVDTSQGIDLIPQWIFLDMRVRMLSRFDIDALCGACGRAQEARRASDRTVCAQGQTMASAVILRVNLALLRVLGRHRRAPCLRETKEMSDVE